MTRSSFSSSSPSTLSAHLRILWIQALLLVLIFLLFAATNRVAAETLEPYGGSSGELAISISSVFSHVPVFLSVGVKGGLCWLVDFLPGRW